jgi:hypothetical protein
LKQQFEAILELARNSVPVEFQEFSRSSREVSLARADQADIGSLEPGA